MEEKPVTLKYTLILSVENWLVLNRWKAETGKAYGKLINEAIKTAHLIKEMGGLERIREIIKENEELKKMLADNKKIEQAIKEKIKQKIKEKIKEFYQKLEEKDKKRVEEILSYLITSL